ncbi:MAG: hypothetical protein HRU38_17320 [Saccharospirillaceae bacterium]|nr:hypothetical protein [Pseudomonadales bacterium]NRB80399.1 hypothetical protein [Saccharospirillaceae bacterium]
MHFWITLIKAGNSEFILRKFNNAINFYQQALKQCQIMFSEHVEENADEAIAIMIISYCNIADTKLERNEIQAACLEYEKAFQFISTLQKMSTNAEILEASFKASSQLHRQWFDCLKRYEHQLKNVAFLNGKTTRLFGKYSHPNSVLSYLNIKNKKFPIYENNNNLSEQH